MASDVEITPATGSREEYQPFHVSATAGATSDPCTDGESDQLLADAIQPPCRRVPRPFSDFTKEERQMCLDVDSDGSGDLSDFSDLSDEDFDEDWDTPRTTVAPYARAPTGAPAFRRPSGFAPYPGFADFRFTVAPATREPATTPAPPVHVPSVTPVAAPPPCVPCAARPKQQPTQQQPIDERLVVTLTQMQTNTQQLTQAMGMQVEDSMRREQVVVHMQQQQVELQQQAAADKKEWLLSVQSLQQQLLLQEYQQLKLKSTKKNKKQKSRKALPKPVSVAAADAAAAADVVAASAAAADVAARAAIDAAANMPVDVPATYAALAPAPPAAAPPACSSLPAARSLLLLVLLLSSVAVSAGYCYHVVTVVPQQALYPLPQLFCAICSCFLLLQPELTKYCSADLLGSWIFDDGG
jgi:hypothetical protein